MKNKKGIDIKGCPFRLRLSEQDRHFIRELGKYGDSRSNRSNEKYLTQAFSRHLRAVFVMQTALMFKAAGWITPAGCDAVFNDLDRAFENFDRVVDRYDRRFKSIYKKKLGRKK